MLAQQRDAQYDRRLARNMVAQHASRRATCAQGVQAVSPIDAAFSTA